MARDGRVLARRFVEEREAQAALAVPMIDEVVARAGLDRGDLTGVLVGAGPGSFTGVRVAAATAKGLVHALGLPLWARSSLAAAAVGDVSLPPGAGPWNPASPPVDIRPEEVRWVLFDARGDRVYAACYRLIADGGLVTVAEPRATSVTALLADRFSDGGRVPEPLLSGDGALRHRDRLAAAGLTVLGAPAGLPTADGLIHLHRGAPGAPLDDAARWEPEYLKASSAERERTARD